MKRKLFLFFVLINIFSILKAENLSLFIGASYEYDPEFFITTTNIIGANRIIPKILLPIELDDDVYLRIQGMFKYYLPFVRYYQINQTFEPEVKVSFEVYDRRDERFEVYLKGNLLTTLINNRTPRLYPSIEAAATLVADGVLLAAGGNYNFILKQWNLFGEYGVGIDRQELYFSAKLTSIPDPYINTNTIYLFYMGLGLNFNIPIKDMFIITLGGDMDYEFVMEELYFKIRFGILFNLKELDFDLY